MWGIAQKAGVSRPPHRGEGQTSSKPFERVLSPRLLRARRERRSCYYKLFWLVPKEHTGGGGERPWWRWVEDHGGWSFATNHHGLLSTTTMWFLLVPDFPNFRQKVFPGCPSNFVVIVVSYMASLRLFGQELRIIAKVIQAGYTFCPAIRERHGAGVPKK